METKRKLTNHLQNIKAINELIKEYAKHVVDNTIKSNTIMDCVFCKLYNHRRTEITCKGCPHIEINKMSCSLIEKETYVDRISELVSWRKMYEDDMNKALTTDMGEAISPKEIAEEIKKDQAVGLNTKDREVVTAYMREIADVLDANEKNGKGDDECTASFNFYDGHTRLDIKFHVVLRFPKTGD